MSKLCADTSTVLTVEQLTLNRGSKVALWEANFTLRKGMLCGVIGPNGAGKSTLLKAIMGLLPIASGSIKKDVSIAYVPQTEEVDWDFPITLREVVLMGRFSRMGPWKWPKKADHRAVDAVLAEIGLASAAERQISELSGGQKQRAFLARAILQDADLYLLDEPFTGVDHTTEKKLIALFKQWQEAGKTLLIVHHNLSQARALFDTLLLLNGRVVAFGPFDQVFTEENLAKTYSNHAVLLQEMLTLDLGKKTGVIK